MITTAALKVWLTLLDDIMLGDERGLITLRTEMLRELRDPYIPSELEAPRLRPLEPIRPKKAHGRKNWVDTTPGKTGSVVCPLCDAGVGMRCFRMTHAGTGGKPTKDTILGFHSSRTELAKSIRKGTASATQEEG